MKYKVIVSPRARGQLKEIHGHLKENFSKKRAAEFNATFRKVVKALRQMPRMYEAVPDAPGVHKCSALSPTLILYEVFEMEKRVEIMTLYDGRYEHD